MGDVCAVEHGDNLLIVDIIELFKKSRNCGKLVLASAEKVIVIKSDIIALMDGNARKAGITGGDGDVAGGYVFQSARHTFGNLLNGFERKVHHRQR